MKKIVICAFIILSISVYQQTILARQSSVTVVKNKIGKNNRNYKKAQRGLIQALLNSCQNLCKQSQNCVKKNSDSSRLKRMEAYPSKYIEYTDSKGNVRKIKRRRFRRRRGKSASLSTVISSAYNTCRSTIVKEIDGNRNCASCLAKQLKPVKYVNAKKEKDRRRKNRKTKNTLEKINKGLEVGKKFL